MTQELIAELREWRVASAPYEPEYKVPPPKLHLKAADALERMEDERDAALAASRHETDLCQQALEDLEKMRGESGVLRELLAESLRVIKTIDGADECECDLLESLCDKIKAAITPQAETVDLL